MKQPTPTDGVILKAGREKPIRQGHPWIFSGAIAQLPSKVANGDLVDVYGADGTWLARGYLNRTSQIQVRILSWQAAEPIDQAFWQRRLAQAIAGRAALAATDATTVYRLVHGESDFLPGLIVDRYGDYLVMQVGTLGIERHKALLATLLQQLTGCRGIIERSDIGARRQEGMAPTEGLLLGQAPVGPVHVREQGFTFEVDLHQGQKGGFYADQRNNRQLVARLCQDKRVLNAFSYTGAFAVYALAAGASHVTNIDSSVEALTLAETNLRLNGFDPDQQSENIAGDVFQVLRDWRDERVDPFDLIILDPPKFAQVQANLDRALRGYKDINLLALGLLKPGGTLATFSCSGLVSLDLFQKVVFGAAVDANRQVQIGAWLHQAEDHPVAITFPEGEYLKGLLCRVLA